MTALVDFLYARLNDPLLCTPLRDLKAKRLIVELHTGDHECSTYDHNGEIDNCTWVLGDCSTLQLLAIPFADHPDYRQEWTPRFAVSIFDGSPSPALQD